MPTQSEPRIEESQGAEWKASDADRRRSVFGNFKSQIPAPLPSDMLPSFEASEAAKSDVGHAPMPILQVRIDAAMGRLFLYQFLARAFDEPAIETWSWLTDSRTHESLRYAVVGASLPGPWSQAVTVVLERAQADQFDSFQSAYITAFGHAARGDCPLNEIEYGDLKADPLFQPHRLADLAAFYRAFGLEVADGAAERPDHLCMELEFMAILKAKEAYAREHQLDTENLDVSVEAQKRFLREHLGRWAPAFARRLGRVATDRLLSALAQLLEQFILAECEAFGIAAGNEDLLLRPVDEANESLCASCGLQNGLPK